MNLKIKLVVVAALAVAVAGAVVAKRNVSGNARGGSEVVGIPAAAESTAGVPRLVDLGSTTCIPCKMMAPILDELQKDYAGRMNVEFIDVKLIPDAAKAFKISVIPTQVFFSAEGKELFRHEGYWSREDILGKWKELGVEFKEKAAAGTEKATTGN